MRTVSIMLCSKSAEPAPGPPSGSLAAALLASVIALGACDLDAGPAPASLRVVELDLVHGHDSARLQAQLELRLSDAVLDALHNGVPLTFVWELELIERRDWLWDAEIWSIGGSRQLRHRSLSRRYTVTTGGPDPATSFPDVDRVLAALSQLDVVVPLTRDQMDAVARPYFRLRTRLDIASLPPPLRLPSYISADWRLDSGWHAFAPG